MLFLVVALAGFFAVALIVFAYVFYGAPARAPEDTHLPVVIVVRNPPALDPAWVSFRERMEELGYREGENIRYVVTDVSTNLDSTKLFPLKGDLAGLYKLLEGSHRIIFEVLRTERTIIVHAIGHRRDIYKRR